MGQPAAVTPVAHGSVTRVRGSDDPVTHVAATTTRPLPRPVLAADVGTPPSQAQA